MTDAGPGADLQEAAPASLPPGRRLPPSEATLRTPLEAKAFCLSPPRFEGGIVELSGAEVWPATRYYKPEARGNTVYHDGGVFHAGGRPCIEAVNAFAGVVHYPEKGAAPAPAALDGAWLFGGYVRVHFGALLLYCLGRLWALEELRDAGIRGVILLHNDAQIAQPAERVLAAAGRVTQRTYVRDLLGLMSDGREVLVPTGPLVVERLFVPAPLTGNMVLQGHPIFRRQCAALHAAADAHAAGRGASGRSLYVSRSRLDVGLSQFLLETLLERNLVAEGYEVMHPQEMSILDQLAAYRQAERILVAEGSAVHLLAMVARPEHRIGVIQRRLDNGRFAAQLRAFGAGEAHTLSAIAGRVVPKEEALRDTPRANAAAPAVLDFAVLRDLLAGHGFIAGRSWHLPDPAELDAAVADYAAARNRLAAARKAPAEEFALQLNLRRRF